uniref:Uncharacterized protein n=1 Tax=Triticum urartu TaxID=4572 RepID=A0A8R7NX59_TRIUA
PSPAQYDKDASDNENSPHSRAAECILAIYISEPHQFSVISPDGRRRSVQSVSFATSTCKFYNLSVQMGEGDQSNRRIWSEICRAIRPRYRNNSIFFVFIGFPGC